MVTKVSPHKRLLRKGRACLCDFPWARTTDRDYHRWSCGHSRGLSGRGAASREHRYAHWAPALIVPSEPTARQFRLTWSLCRSLLLGQRSGTTAGKKSAPHIILSGSCSPAPPPSSANRALCRESDTVSWRALGVGRARCPEPQGLCTHSSLPPGTSPFSVPTLPDAPYPQPKGRRFPPGLSP